MDIKKVTQKDRYGNQISYEFESEIKPLDQTALMKHAMDSAQDVPMMMEEPMMDHPGGPQGTDTVPAWLTPGEFVVNAEAMRIPGAKEQIESLNDEGRAMQQQQGGSIPSMGYQQGGMIPAPFIAGPRLNEPKYQDDGGWITDNLLDKLAEVESGGNNEAVSPAGAIGKYQWLPSSAKQAGYGVKAFNPKDEKAARAATAKYLRNMQKYHGFTPEETLRAYNWGPGNVLNFNKGKRKDIPDEALNYPGKILGIENTQGVTPPPGEAPALPVARPGQQYDRLSDIPKQDLHRYVQPGPTPRPVEQPTPRPDFNPQLTAQDIDDLDADIYNEGGPVRNPFTPGTYAHQQFEANRAGQVDYTPPPIDPTISPDAGSTSKRDGYGIPDLFTDLLTAGALGFDDGGEVPITSNFSERVYGESGNANRSPNVVPELTDVPGNPMYDNDKPVDFGDQVPGLDAFGDEGQHVPSESWRKSYDESHPEYVPLHGKNKTASDKKALAKAEESLLTADPLSPEYEYKMNNVKNLRETVGESERKDELKLIGEANKKDRINNEEVVAMTNKKEALIQKALEATQNGDWETAELINDQIDAIDKKVETTPNKDEGETKTDKKSKVLNKIAKGLETIKDPYIEKADKADLESKGEASDPAEKKKTEGLLHEVFGDLFDKKELARMAVMYLGGRALGGSHQGSLGYAAKSYVNRIDAKEAGKQKNIQGLLKSGKWDAKSVAAYGESGDISDLKPVGTPINQTGNFKNFYKNGKTFRAQSYKAGDKTFWSADGGKTVINSSYHENADEVKGTKEYNQRISSESKDNIAVIKGLQERFDEIKGKDGVPSTFKTEISPALQGKKIAEWAADNGVDAARVGSLMEQAYHDAINDSANTGRKPRNLVPYLNSLIIREQTGTPELFKVKESEDGTPTFISGSKMRLVNHNILARSGLDGNLKDKRNIDKLNNFWTFAQSKWNGLDPKAREQWNRKAGDDTTGFYEYTNSQLQKTN